MFQQLFRIAGFAEPVIYAYHLHGNRALGYQYLAHRAPHAAADKVLFRGHDSAGLAGGLDYRVFIYGLRSMQVHHPGFYAFFRELLMGKYGFMHHDTARYYGYIAALSQRHRLSYLEGVALRGDAGDRTPSQSYIYRAFYIDAFYGGLFRLCGIAGNDNGHVRQHAHEPYLFYGLVRRPVRAYRYASVRAYDLHAQVHVGYGYPYLVPRPAAGEDPECRGERYLARKRQARRCAVHVLLGYAHRKEPLGELLPEPARARGFRKVRAQRDHVLISVAQFYQALSKTVTRGFHPVPTFLTIAFPVTTLLVKAGAGFMPPLYLLSGHIGAAFIYTIS